MVTPICARCEVWMKSKADGIRFEEKLTDGEGTTRGYKLWLGDLWECPHCAAQVIIRVGHQPIANSNDYGYARLVETHEPGYTVES